MNIKILITEDHELYRDGLRLLLQETLPEVHVIEASDFATTRASLTAHQDIALVLFDIHIPGTTGLEGLKEIKSSHPALPVVVISTADRQASIQQMLQAGADGFIAKSSSKATMVKALQDILEGEVVIVSGEDVAEPVTLSPRQFATLELLASGLPNKEIAAHLDISPATAREHVSDLLGLLECDNRTQAVLKARRLGFILD